MSQISDVLSIDTETTHWDHTRSEFAVIQYSIVDSQMVGTMGYLNPGTQVLTKMPPNVIGVTGLTPAKIRERADASSDAIFEACCAQLSEMTFVAAAHNWRFDRDALTVECNRRRVINPFKDVPFIDTYRIALELYDKGDWDGYGGSFLPDHKLATCFYGIVPEKDWSLLPEGSSHDAQYDACMVMLLVKTFVEMGLTVDKLIEISSTLFVPRNCPIGDERGKPWKDVSSGFLTWMLNKKVWGTDEGLEYAILEECMKRGIT